MFSVKRFLKFCLPAAFLFAGGVSIVSAAPSAADKRLLKQAEIQFRKHGKFCVCEDCRTLKSHLKARGLMVGRLGEKTGGKPIFEGPGITRPRKPSRPVLVSPPVSAPVASKPVGSAGRRLVMVARGRPLHPFRNIVFPPMATLPPPIVVMPTPPVTPPPPEVPARSGRGHGVRIPDPRLGLVAKVSGVPQGSVSLKPPSIAPSRLPPTTHPPAFPPGLVRPADLNGLPGRPVAIPGQPRPVNVLPGRPAVSPVGSGLPGRAIPSPITPGLPGRPVNAPSVSGLPGRPAVPSIPGSPVAAPSNSGGNLQERIQALVRQGVPPAAINMQTGIVRMNLQGQYLNESGRVIHSGRPR